MSSAKERFRQLYRAKLAARKQQRGGGNNQYASGPNPLNVFPSNMMVNGHREAIVQRFHDYICFKRDSLQQIGRALVDTMTT